MFGLLGFLLVSLVVLTVSLLLLVWRDRTVDTWRSFDCELLEIRSLGPHDTERLVFVHPRLPLSVATDLERPRADSLPIFGANRLDRPSSDSGAWIEPWSC